ncbi:adenylate/guanylate cyclase domain-containing protein [uncultured Ferrovibrio sp.]|jgi:adenylate cyclase|uniref:adenylate/guanylate cyclase domain-containing protein n=1 Tax=uncultured Ferrovibrio sp. TaxID=1576913 RepID=UPI0026141852|nr:adenylate/guanylate cyclase domain-containing protein [uncultured Ferrovibrio sp.]
MLTKRRGPRLRPSISLVLVGGVGLLILLSCLAFGIAMVTGRQNTVDLLRDRNERIVQQLVERTRLQLDPAHRQIEAFRNRIVSKHLPLNDVGRLTDYMTSALDSLPQVDAIGLVRNDFVATRVFRHASQLVAMHDKMTDDAVAATRMQALRQSIEAPQTGMGLHRDVRWGALIWAPELQQPLINTIAPVVMDGVFVGGVVALVSLGSLSRLLEVDSVDGEAVNFILYGEDAVLAHPSLLNHQYELSMEHPLPSLDEIHDPVLRQIWSGRIELQLANAMLGDGGNAHVVETEDGRRWIFVYRKIDGYGEKPWVVGRYFSFDEIELEVTRLRFSAVVGALALILFSLIAWRLGYHIRRPILAISAAANRLRNLDFDSPPLERVRLRELDDAAQAINAANAALHWFGNYVPRKLVNRLIREGEDAISVSKHREVTVMFTDLVGFTSMSERLTAQETADLLNEHFALVTACIEAEGGMVDKFIGDAVMAVWGAIKRDPDHATHACRAARAITAALAADNARRMMLGKPILRMRIGIHTGPVVIGNIGAPGRINYTVVGDTVNTAQRLEQLGREHMQSDSSVLVLLSAETAEAAKLDPRPKVIGRFPVKGRAAPIEVCRLEL